MTMRAAKMATLKTIVTGFTVADLLSNRRKFQLCENKKRRTRLRSSAVASRAPLLCDRPQTEKLQLCRRLHWRKLDRGLAAFDGGFVIPCCAIDGVGAFENEPFARCDVETQMNLTVTMLRCAARRSQNASASD